MFDLKGFLTDRGVSYTENEDGSITFTPINSQTYMNPFQFSDEDIIVSLSGLITNVSSTNARVQLVKKDGSSASIISEEINTLNNRTANKIRFDWSTAGTITMKNIMLNEGTTAEPYEPYTGGIASPNPDYSQEIHRTGDNGSVNEKVQNKNIVSLETSKEKVVDGLPFTVEDGIIKINGTNTSTNSFFFDSFKTNSGTAMFWVEISGYTDKDSGNASILLQQSDDNIKFSTLVEVQLKSNLNKTRQVTLDSNKYYRIRFYVNKNTFTNSEIKVQLEYGNQKTTFIPHTEQNISFPLGQGQVLAQGDYLADDGIHHVRKQAVISIERIITISSNGNKAGIVTLSDKKFFTTKTILCTNCTYSQTGYTPNTFYENPGNIVMVGTTEDTLETLREKYNGGIIEYDLAEEVVEPFTEEQQQVWEQIKKIKTYKNVTHISSTDETPATLDFVYVRDLQTVINNLSN